MPERALWKLFKALTTWLQPWRLTSASGLNTQRFIPGWLYNSPYFEERTSKFSPGRVVGWCCVTVSLSPSFGECATDQIQRRRGCTAFCGRICLEKGARDRRLLYDSVSSNLTSKMSWGAKEFGSGLIKILLKMINRKRKTLDKASVSDFDLMEKYLFPIKMLLFLSPLMEIWIICR